MMCFRLISLFMLMLAVFTSFLSETVAQVPGQKNAEIQKKQKGASLNITIKTYDYKIDEKTKRDLEFGLANIFTFFHYRFRIGYRLPLHMKVNIFKTGEQFDRFIGQPGLSSRVAGLYMFNTKEVSVHWTKPREQMISTTIHETSHRVLGEAIKSSIAPMWLNEGLAEYFAQARASGNSVVIKPDTSAESFLRAAMKNNALPPLRQHLNTPRVAWQSGDPRMNYSLAWSLVSFLMSTNSGKGILKKILYELAYERPNTYDSAAAINKYYKGGLEYFERDWKKYIEGRKKTESYTRDVRRRAAFEVIPAKLTGGY